MQQDLFHQDITIFPLQAKDKTDAVQQIGQKMVQAGYIKPEYIEAVLKREETFPTGLALQDTNIAIPHATPEGNVLKNGIAAAKLAEPVAFQSMEDPEQAVEVNFIFLLALKSSDEHLDMLKKLFLMFQSPEVIQELIATKDAYALINELNRNLQAE